MTSDLFSLAVAQALPELDFFLENKRWPVHDRKGMRAFADDLVYAVAHGTARPQLKKTTTRHKNWLRGWNTAYAITYPIIGDLEP